CLEVERLTRAGQPGVRLSLVVGRDRPGHQWISAFITQASGLNPPDYTPGRAIYGMGRPPRTVGSLDSLRHSPTRVERDADRSPFRRRAHVPRPISAAVPARIREEGSGTEPTPLAQEIPLPSDVAKWGSLRSFGP